MQFLALVAVLVAVLVVVRLGAAIAGAVVKGLVWLLMLGLVLLVLTALRGVVPERAPDGEGGPATSRSATLRRDRLTGEQVIPARVPPGP
ncbi:MULTISPECIES: hypothetical protein [unclassified Blastococcus]